MQADNRRPPRRRLIDALHRAVRETGGLGAVFGQQVAKRFGISHGDLECIDLILLRGRVTAGDLAEATGLTTGAVTGIIDRLERTGFARRERDTADRRKVYVSILPAAYELGMKYYGPLEKAMAALLDAYSDAEIALLADYFARSREVMVREIEKLKRVGEVPAAPVRSPRR
jgi:DNA-binding MarR family transcriptional regulator